MTTPSEVLGYWWEHYRERPFLRLVRIFVERIFRGGGDMDAEGLDLGVGLVLALLALPGGFVSVLMFVKYSTFLSWMRGAPQVDPLMVALPDEYFFITLAMAVSGTVAVWRWETLFPDRRDYMNFVPLPVSTALIFFANLAAVLFLALLIALDVNTASSVLFPLGVAATQSSFLFFVKFTAVHALVVGMASVFAFSAVLSLLGLFLVILPPRAFQNITPYVRALVIIYFVALLTTSFELPEFLRRSPEAPHHWLAFLPSYWFLGLCQVLRGRADSTLISLARMALPGLAFTIASAVCFYALGYGRYFLRIPEMGEAPSDPQGQSLTRLATFFDRWILRTPFQQGCFHFVWRTLYRSEAHRLALAGISGLGIVLASQSLAGAVQTNFSPQSGPPAQSLAVPLILAFFVIVGLRAVFEIPVDLHSNWIFRLTLDPEKHECQPVGRLIILTFVLPLLMLAYPVYWYVYGWRVAGLHTLLVLVWSLLLTHAVLIRFRKMPFTCSMPLFQQHSMATLSLGILGFFLFAVLTPQAEAWALSEPLRMLGFIPMAGLFWYIPHRVDRAALDVDKKLIFEETPTRAVELLQLGD